MLPSQKSIGMVKDPHQLYRPRLSDVRTAQAPAAKVRWAWGTFQEKGLERTSSQQVPEGPRHLPSSPPEPPPKRICPPKAELEETPPSCLGGSGLTCLLASNERSLGATTAGEGTHPKRQPFQLLSWVLAA